VNFLSTYSDKKSCHTSTTLQTSNARFVSDSWASCLSHRRRSKQALCCCLEGPLGIQFNSTNQRRQLVHANTLSQSQYSQLPRVQIPFSIPERHSDVTHYYRSEKVIQSLQRFAFYASVAYRLQRKHYVLTCPPRHLSRTIGVSFASHDYWTVNIFQWNLRQVTTYTTNRLNDYILGEIRTRTRKQSTRENTNQC